MEKKTTRKPNWTAEQTLFLTRLVEEKKAVLLGKFGPGVTSARKKETWTNITKQINAAFTETDFGMASVTHVGEETAEDKKESTIPLDMVDEENLDIGPKMYLDAARVYTKFCHVTADNELVNSPSSEISMNTIRFRHYYGTCGQPIPLVTPSETPPSIRYWETHIRVGVKRPVWSVMEMAVLEEGQVDRKYLACYQPRSWGINISRCDKHKCICTKVYKEGEYVTCSPNTMTEAPGTQTTLNYGVVLDVGRGRVAFIDIDKEVVMAKLDVEFREVLYPMFSVGPWPDYFTAVMKLVCGEDITMTKTKKLLIRSALT